MKTFKIYYLSNFQIYNIVNYSHHAVHYISWWFIYLITRSVYLFTPSPICQAPTPALPATNLNVLFLWVLFCFLDSTYKWDHTVFVFLCLIYIYLTFSLTIHPSVDTWLIYNREAKNIQWGKNSLFKKKTSIISILYMEKNVTNA